ncbi:PPC domain-containing protein [Aquimarina sp. 2201CG5-10]|uniref:PPC domain-containing protein n=1 Tax=Aquimarina callyspongiae TaxID=3098150 RepID=UPI002AB4403B|nr:PPC domain-containing protein [Aquimarina sp. 2201CG5-10]MDY8135086.1 PPC domain-containing protein [Aquimarina sp. 2201CG5-10]
MKTQVLKIVALLGVIVLTSCSKDDDVPVETGITLFEEQGEWNCELSQTCEDIYQFELKEGSRISISIEEVTGLSVVSLDLSADFGQFGGPNLLNEGAITYYGCTVQDEEISITNILISETGTYNLAVARDWNLSAGFDGTYTLVILSDTAFTEGVTPINDAEATNYQRECL